MMAASVEIGAVVVEDLLIDGGSDGWSANAWGVIVDGVMGGKSSGFVDFSKDAPQVLEFTGAVS
jgi:hypothetical protein